MAPQTVVFREGEDAKFFYLVAHGLLSVRCQKKKNLIVQPQQTQEKDNNMDNNSKNTSNNNDNNGDMQLQTRSRAPLSQSPVPIKNADTVNNDIPQGRIHQVHSNAAEDIELCQLAPGNYFGESALTKDGKRKATVVAATRYAVFFCQQHHTLQQ